MKKNGLIKIIFLTLAFLAGKNFSFADVVTSEVFKYSIDFPEGFQITDYSEDERLILFEHSMLPVQTIIRVWPQELCKDSQKALEQTRQKLSATGEITEIKWRNKKCALSQIQVNQNALGQKMSGWAAAFPLTESKDFLTVLCLAPEDKTYDCEQFILSILDSVLIDKGSLHEQGIITAFAFPKTGKRNLVLNIGDISVPTFLDKSDEEASQFVIDREFEVFKVFASTQFWKEAWQRFYRIVAKDSYGRIKQCAFDINSALMEQAKKEDPELPEGAIAQKLLYWVQDFKYERKSASADKADLASVPSVLCGKSSDCDSRSMLVMLLLKNMNIDSCMLISVDYSHAMLGVCLPGKQGQTYSLDGRDYLFGETTVKKLTLGKISADMQDRSKWIPVELYD